MGTTGALLLFVELCSCGQGTLVTVPLLGFAVLTRMCKKNSSSEAFP